MLELPEKLYRVAVGGLVIANVLLVCWLGAALQPRLTGRSASGTSIASSFGLSGDSPNVVTNLFVTTADMVERTTNSLNQATLNSIQAIDGAVAGTGRLVASTARGGTRLVGGSLLRFGSFCLHCYGMEFRIAGRGLGTMLRLPTAAIGLIGRTPSVSALIMPGSGTRQPVINAPAPAALPTVRLAGISRPADSQTRPQWPIHGVITTLFGVPEPPYEPIHTGLDISDGKPAGVTPIHPFEPGRVIAVIHSSRGLGNHIVIDHGHGLTSVYGHLHATSVHTGQLVNEQTVLGYEGSTGVSTGPHLHFEIRQDGQPRDPHHYIAGQP